MLLKQNNAFIQLELQRFEQLKGGLLALQDFTLDKTFQPLGFFVRIPDNAAADPVACLSSRAIQHQRPYRNTENAITARFQCAHRTGVNTPGPLFELMDDLHRSRLRGTGNRRAGKQCRKNLWQSGFRHGTHVRHHLPHRRQFPSVEQAVGLHCTRVG